MRLFISFRGGMPVVLPLNYNHAVQSMLYSVLPDKDFSNLLHETGFSAGGKTFRLFTFGPLLGPHRVEGKQICFTEGIRLELRSPFPELLLRFSAALVPGSCVNLLGQVLSVTESQLTEASKASEQEWIRMQSPIVVYTTQERKTLYRSPADEDFSDLVNVNFQNKFYAAYREQPAGPVTLRAGETHKIVTRYKDFVIVGWLGTFQLSGQAEYLDFLYHAGIGAKNAQGFGLFSYMR